MKTTNIRTTSNMKLQLFASMLAVFCCASLLHAGGSWSLFAPGAPEIAEIIAFLNGGAVNPNAVANSLMAGCEDPNEPNNNAATATGPIAYGSTNPGCIDPADQDWFSFTATAGEIIIAN